MNTAKKVKSLLMEVGSGSKQTCYELSKSMDYKQLKFKNPLEDDSVKGLQTLVFPANKDSQITDWGRMEGSREEEVDDKEILSNIGYKLI